MLSRRDLLAGATALAASAGSAAAAPKRNFVLILIDDLLSVVYSRTRYGARIVAPNLFQLMDEGVSFTNAFASTALCNPSRTSILSGMNPYKTGVHDNDTPWINAINIQDTFPAILSANGWRCFMYGKIGHGHATSWKQAGICEDVQLDGPLGTIASDREITTTATARIRNLRTVREPWLLMFGLTGSHLPNDATPDLRARYPLSQITPVDWSGDGPSSCVGAIYDIIHQEFEQLRGGGRRAVKEYIQAYLAGVTAMDRELGRFLTALKTSGLDPTIILSSDHGFHLGEHDVLLKFTLWDEAARAPLVIRYPNCPKVSIKETVSLLDIAPTILHLAGLPKPAYMDGQSLYPYIKNPALKRISGAMTTVYESISFRNNRYRLCRYSPCDELELYDQALDPQSRNNVVAEPSYSAVKDAMILSMDELYAAWTT